MFRQGGHKFFRYAASSSAKKAWGKRIHTRVSSPCNIGINTFLKPNTASCLFKNAEAKRALQLSLDRAIANNTMIIALSTKIPMLLNDVAGLLETLEDGADLEETDEGIMITKPRARQIKTNF